MSHRKTSASTMHVSQIRVSHIHVPQALAGVRAIGLVMAVLTVAACATSEKSTDPLAPNASNPLRADGPANLPVPRNHVDVIERSSAGDSQFSGLYNTFELKATILNSTVREALVRRQAEYYQWDEPQIAAEREKAQQQLSSGSEVFLSFATPERRNDNLADAKSIWRIFLDVGGRRYVGQVKKDRRLVAELQSLFPYHTRWNTPYTLTFPVAMTAIESSPIKLTVTGPLGSRVLQYSPQVSQSIDHSVLSEPGPNQAPPSTE